MASSRTAVDPRSPPRDFDDLVEWFDRLSTNLVLLEEYPLDDLRGAMHSVDDAISAHVRSAETEISGAAADSSLADLRAILRSDHAWFAISLEQLSWFLGIVEGEDHGGHRQALGQYGRLLAESLRRHRTHERAFLAAAKGPGTRRQP